MVLSILTLITFLVIIIILEKNNGKDLFPLFLPLAKGKFSLDEDGNLYSSEFFEKNKWIGVLTQILVFAILLVVFSKNENLELAEKIALFFPAYFTFEWIIYLGFIIVKNSFIILSKSKELLILFFSTGFAIIYSIIIYHNEPFWVLFLLLIVIINLLQTINIMYKLCIRENDFFKEEFENITAVKQIFVIMFIIMVHLCNFILLVYTYCNRKTDGFLTRNGDSITKLKDVIYYVIITYTTVGYGDIVPGCSDAQFLAIIISITSMITTAVIIGKITSATISQVVTKKRMEVISHSDVKKYLSSIKNIINRDGKIIVAYRNKEYMMQNDISIDTLKDILMNLKPSDYRMSFVDLGAKEDEKIQIFMPTYNNKKLYLKLKMIENNIFCISLHEQ